jgi:hypothetical protein
MNQLLTLLELPVSLLGCVRYAVRKAVYVRLGILSISCVMAFLLAGCSRPINNSSVLTLEHTISPDPPRVGPTTIVLRLTDRDARPLSGARIMLEADMSHPGMAPVFEEANETAPGQYQAHFNFGMAGDWIVLLHVRLPGGQTLERQFKVSGVRPN